MLKQTISTISYLALFILILRLSQVGSTRFTCSVQDELIQKGFSSIFWKHIVFANRTYPSEVSSKCLQHCDEIIRSAHDGLSWAFKYLSASGAIPYNFLKGSYTTLGNYDSCLELQNDLANGDKVKGQYCLTSVLPDFDGKSETEKIILEKLYPHHFDARYNLTIKVGLCIPSSCSVNDVRIIMNQALASFSWKLVDVNQCGIKTTFSNRWSTAYKSQKICLYFLSALIGLVMIATFIDKQVYHGNLFVGSRVIFWLQHFSMIRSFRNLLHGTESGRVEILDKLRLCLQLMVVLAHAIMWFVLISAPFIIDESERILALLSKLYTQPFFNDWPLELIIFLGGLSASTNLFRKMKHSTPIWTYVWQIIRRILIFLPPILVLIAAEITLPLFGSGPFYQSISQHRSYVCKKNFIKNILHTQNYANHLEICAPHTWSFGAELQLFAMACCAIFIYKRYPRIGFSFNIAMILFGLYHVAWLFQVYDLLPQMIIKSASFEAINRRLEYYYIATGAHIWSYFTALFVVKIMSDNLETKIDQSFIKKFFLFISVATVLNSFSTSIWNIFEAPIEPISRTVYIIVYKIITGLFFSLFIIKYADQFRQFFTPSSTKINEKSNSSLVNYFDFMMKLVKSTYYVHSIVFSWYFSSLRSPIPANLYDWLYSTGLLITMAIISGFIFHILVLGPLDSILFSLKKSNSHVKSHKY